jgi:hypothetical protein
MNEVSIEEVTKFLKEFDEGKHPLSQKDLDALGTAGFRQYLKASIELTRLRAENEELRKDKERLDRLESKSDGSSWIVEDDGYRFALVLTRRDMSYHPDARSTARGAIDAAMQTEKEPNK